MNTTKISHFPKKKCGVLGCTGSVGQRFILLLALHPHFALHVVGASERSAGKKYKVNSFPLSAEQQLLIPSQDVVQWKQAITLPKAYGELVVKSCESPEEFKDCNIVFSGLDSDVAGRIGRSAFIRSMPSAKVCARNEIPKSRHRRFLQC